MPVLEDRELLKSGVSLISHEQAADIIVRDGELPPHFKVDITRDSKAYELITNQSVTINGFYNEYDLPNLTHTQEQLLELVDILDRSPRYEDKYFSRVETELEFFERTLNIKFLLRLHRLVEEFKQAGVVWGVGRGSACASYVLFLLEVHDINPCEYGIPFYELSKEN